MCSRTDSQKTPQHQHIPVQHLLFPALATGVEFSKFLSLSPVQSIFNAPYCLPVHTISQNFSTKESMRDCVKDPPNVTLGSISNNHKLGCPGMSYPWYTHASCFQLPKLSIVSWEIASDGICPITDEVRPLLGSFSCKMDVMFAFFQSSETFPNFHLLLKMLRLVPQQHQLAPLVAMDTLHLEIRVCVCLIFKNQEWEVYIADLSTYIFLVLPSKEGSSI